MSIARILLAVAIVASGCGARTEVAEEDACVPIVVRWFGDDARCELATQTVECICPELRSEIAECHVDATGRVFRANAEIAARHPSRPCTADEAHWLDLAEHGCD